MNRRQSVAVIAALTGAFIKSEIANVARVARAAGMAAAWRWRQKGCRMQEVSVDAAAAVAAMQSYKFMKVNGQASGAVMDKLTDAYRLKDGRWIYLHCNFPNLAEKNCFVLGAQMTPESIREHVAQWDGGRLEEALFAAGGRGALVRSPQEWRALPQGVAAAAEPALEIVRIGDAPAQPLPRGNRPLSGVRVLHISRPGLADSGVLDFDTGWASCRPIWICLMPRRCGN